MNIVAVVQARLGSKRFPRKSLADLDGRPLLSHVLERARAIAKIDSVILGVPEGKEAYADLARRVRGTKMVMIEAITDVPEDDVLRRVHRLATSNEADVVVRITGDCPLFAPDLADRVLDRFFDERADYAWNDTLATGWPDGTDVEVFSWALLDRAFRENTTPQDREHVTPIMRRLPGVRLTTLTCPKNYAMHKWSVDTPEDLEVVRAILAEHPKDFTFNETLKAAERAAKKVA